MTKRATYNLYEAKTALSSLVERAARGEAILISKAGVPKAKLVAADAPRRRRRPGGWEGQVWISEDFDSPLPSDLRPAFEGESDGDE